MKRDVKKIGDDLVKKGHQPGLHFKVVLEVLNQREHTKGASTIKGKECYERTV